MESTTRKRITPDLAADLRRWRQARGLSQTELAYRVGVSRVMITWLEGGRRAPSLHTAAALGLALDLPEALRRRLFEQARRAGRSSPYRTGDWP